MIRALCCFAPIAAAAFFATSCAHIPTELERQKSFEGYSRGANAKPLDFFLERSALLFSGKEMLFPLENGRYSPHTADGSNMGLGVATAIDPRGYFLTAAHCTDEPLYVMVPMSPTTAVIRQAKVIWRSTEADIAVIHAPIALKSWFEWGGEAELGARVVSVGQLRPEKTGMLWLAGFSGRTVRKTVGRDSTVIIYHTSPGHAGDSGGPFATADGRLIGINTGAVQIIPGTRTFMNAIRPSPAMIREIISKEPVEADKPG